MIKKKGEKLKKNLIIFGLIFYVLCCSFLLYSLNDTTLTNADNSLYGQVITNNVYLKKSPSKLNDNFNTYFLLEESYFVKVLSEENDFYYVEYLDIKGYIDKSAINLVNENIENPYLNNIKFDIIKNTNLYRIPNNDANEIIDTIDIQQNVFYYGKIFGEEIFENSGNVWYYCKIQDKNKTINAYIHSSFTNNLTPIKQNENIVTNFISKNNINTILSLNLSTQTIIILIISLPILFLIFLFLKGFKKN